MAGTKKDGSSQDVFDVANWLDRANGRPPVASNNGESAPAPSAYAPRHRADVPVDSVA
jgi:hypothetical protein